MLRRLRMPIGTDWLVRPDQRETQASEPLELRDGVRIVPANTAMVSRFGSGTPWEPVVGYSRAVRAGPFIFVAGTTATGRDGQITQGSGAYDQARQALDNVRRALERAGAGMRDVVQTRLYVTDIDSWEEIARAHGEVFGEIRPVTAMVEVARLIDPDMLVEIEAVAYVDPRGD